MNYTVLAAELSDDPLVVGYAGMTDAEAAVSLNLANRTRPRSMLTASEVFNAIAIGEWTVLTDAQQERIWDVLHIGDINPFGNEATIFIDVFGSFSDTIEALGKIRQEAISRATELGLGHVKTGYVQRARVV